MNEALHRVPRNERRRLLAAEARNRKSGSWGVWEHVSIPRGTVGDGWAAEITEVYRNSVFCVLKRVVETPQGPITHLGISSLSGERPTWPEAQRIKDEIAGPTATAVEVYPPRNEIVDEADMYHLWVLPHALPFSLARA